jgi:hypothetical protein
VEPNAAWLEKRKDRLPRRLLAERELRCCGFRRALGNAEAFLKASLLRLIASAQAFFRG